jgi:pyruvate/2-oxoglutarate dehydrogenase complex dihydrolipoamide acyltransferase (E2) component
MRFGGPNSQGVCVTCSGTGRVVKQPPVKRASQKSTPDLADEIFKLAQLHASGVLTNEEFRLAKAKLLGS